MEHQTTLTRILTPSEQLVGALVCEGLTNRAIAKRVATTEKAVEDAVFRLSRAFQIKSDGECNTRVLLALAYRAYFGDQALAKSGACCHYQSVGPDGVKFCDR